MGTDGKQRTVVQTLRSRIMGNALPLPSGNCAEVVSKGGLSFMTHSCAHPGPGLAWLEGAGAA